jgi:hypothetical protein
MRKFSVDASVMVSPSFLSCRCVPRQTNAFPVPSGMLLSWKRMDRHVRGLGTMPKSAGIHPVSGREMLDVLAGWRTGFLATLSN